ncbi:MAG: prepilin-type N-terminal cleavage/methylation domain-containing protein [Betaproteobacteria bacterium]|nr:prepilin-type N-terminal cleavage/methylation domain-containing protein [Betaproteobacteria bacterium]MDH3438918.1 prepilin-type N-terminal cleavage/methylation domain-containing protein [Betaproteobacteria bacterium]
MFKHLEYFSLSGLIGGLVAGTVPGGVYRYVAVRSLVEMGEENNTSRARPMANAPGWAGFTIVELLIAIAVIAVLSGIAVVSYESYRYKALVAQAKSDVRSLDVLITQYYADNKSFPDSLADIGKAGMLDPWKNPYQYLKLSPLTPGAAGQRRKDKNLVPINADFDLYSMGKDGNSVPPLTAMSSRDDIVRGNNGRFVGLASDY